MGQIVTKNARPKRANLIAIQTGSWSDYVPSDKEFILVDTTNGMTESGEGKFDAYIVGDGKTKAKDLKVYADQRIISNDTYILAFTDGEGKVLIGVKLDGSTFVAKGIPEDTRKELDEILAQIAEMQSDWTPEIQKLQYVFLVHQNDHLMAFVDMLNNFLFGVTSDGDLRTARNIIMGSSQFYERDDDGALFHIIDAQRHVLLDILQNGHLVAGNGITLDGRQSGVFYRNSYDYLFAVTDAEGKVMLAYDKRRGIYCPRMTGVFDAYTVNNRDYLFVFLDHNGNFLCGVKKDGSFAAPKIDLGGIKYIESPEFMYVILDESGKILQGITRNGETFIPKGQPEETKAELKGVKKRLDTLEDVLNNSEFKTKIDYSDKPFLQIPEPRYAVINVISNFNLSNLRKAGYSGGISGVNYNLPTEVEFWDMQGSYFKKWTLMSAQGNSSMRFVKKNLAFDFLNQDPSAEDFDEDDTFKLRIGDWVPQDSFHLKAYYTDFFRGVGPCSYKLYENIVKTRGNRADRPWKKELIDMDAIGVTSKSFDNPIQDDYELQFDTGARCFPDGFPVIVLQNGVFYGVYSWQLKKHRDNMHQSSSKPKHIHLDGTLSQAYIWNGRNNIDWTQFEIRNPKKLVYAEPHLDTESGDYTYKYDADIVQAEIAGTDDKLNAYKGTWDSDYNSGNGYELNAIVDWTDGNGDKHYFLNQKENNKKEPTIDFDKERNIDKDPDFKDKTKCGWINCTNTVKVKDYVMNLSDRIAELKAADATGVSADVKALYEQYFDPENIIDYTIVSDLIRNDDGYSKNWQWFTYDGVKWYVGLYDVDMSFGGDFRGDRLRTPINYHMGTSLNIPTGYINKYYDTELKARFKELMDAGIITAESIFRIVYDWTMRVSEHYFEQEWIKWSNAPCIGESVVRTAYWDALLDEHNKKLTMTEAQFKAQNIYEFDPTNVKKDGDNNPIWYDEEHTKTLAYAAGDRVYFGLDSVMGFYGFECLQDVPTVEGASKRTTSTYSPISYFRHTDNIYRIQKWIEQEVSNMITLYDYE